MRILAIDIGGTAVKMGIVEGDTLHHRREIPTEAQRGAQNMIGRIIAAASEMAPFDGIGVSTASQVNPHTGVITSATDTFPGYTCMNVRQRLSEAFHCPVAVDNDVNCAAVAEGHRGAGREYQSFLCLVYGTGIGGGMVINRQLHYGENYSAGEVGHMKTHAGGLVCNCGLRGCYERYASTFALTRRAEEVLGRPTTGRELCALREGGDPQAQALIDQWIDEVVAGVASLLHIMDPSCVILGGGIMENDYIFQEIARRTPEQTMPNFRNTSILRAQLGNTAGMWGAALLAQRLL